MNFSKTAFCKTCHISDHLQECHSKGHQINDPANNIVEDHSNYPVYNQPNAELLD